MVQKWRRVASVVGLLGLVTSACGRCDDDDAAGGGGGGAGGGGGGGLVGDAGADAGGDDDCVLGALCGVEDVNIAFLTSTVHVLGELGSAEAADAICNQRALEADLPGTYKAWLSTSAESAASRIAPASGWVRPDRRPFARSMDDLLASRVIYPLELDENGARVSAPLAERGVGTGTAADGSTAESQTCGDWMSTAGQAAAGYFTRVARQWTTTLLADCDAASRLYCFGIDHVSEYTVPTVAGRKAFVSVGDVAPDLGVEGADEVCATDAESAGLTGTFLAFLSTSSAPAISRFDTAGPPWVRLDGVPLAATTADLAAGRVDTPIFFDASPTVPTEGLVLWTGGAEVPATLTCDDWMSSSVSDSGFLGRSDDAADWVQHQSTTCVFGPTKVYCLEE